MFLGIWSSTASPTISCELTSPLAGPHAFGASLDEVSDAVAVLAWKAVTKCKLEPFGYTALNLAGVHIAPASTRTYDAEWLTASVDNPQPTGPRRAWDSNPR
jgi:hypothetical protein